MFVLNQPIEFQASVPLYYGVGALIGFSYAQIMVSTFTRAFNASLNLGFADDLKTYLTISGL